MSEIYNTIWQSIQAGGYKLTEMLDRIAALMANGYLSVEEYNGLVAEANAHADPESERPEIQTMLNSLAARVTSLEGRVDALEAGGGDPGGRTETPDYPAWEPWDGMSDNYQYGAIVSHNGKLWQNVLQGMQNTWEPGTVDTRYWVEYTPDGEE